MSRSGGHVEGREGFAMRSVWVVLVSVVGFLAVGTAFAAAAGERRRHRSIPYDRFEKPEVCMECHVDFDAQHRQALMSRASRILGRDRVFRAGPPHSEKEPKVAGVKAGCNGATRPWPTWPGTSLPSDPRREPAQRGGELRSLPLHHRLRRRGPFNFNYIVEPGEPSRGARRRRESVPRDPQESFLAPPSSAASVTTRRTLSACG